MQLTDVLIENADTPNIEINSSPSHQLGIRLVMPEQYHQLRQAGIDAIENRSTPLRARRIRHGRVYGIYAARALAIPV